MILIVIISCISAALFYVLGARVAEAEKELANLWDRRNYSDLGMKLRDYCQGVIAADLLPDALTSGLGVLPVRYRDHSDGFTTVGALLSEKIGRAHV